MDKRYLRQILRSAYLGEKFVLLFDSKLKANRASYEIKNILIGSEKTFQPYIFRKDSLEIGLGRVEIASSEKKLRGSGKDYKLLIFDEMDALGRGRRC